jgi:hypothetical protein
MIREPRGQGTSAIGDQGSKRINNPANKVIERSFCSLALRVSPSTSYEGVATAIAMEMSGRTVSDAVLFLKCVNESEIDGTGDGTTGHFMSGFVTDLLEASSKEKPFTCMVITFVPDCTHNVKSTNGPLTYMVLSRVCV